MGWDHQLDFHNELFKQTWNQWFPYVCFCEKCNVLDSQTKEGALDYDFYLLWDDVLPVRGLIENLGISTFAEKNMRPKTKNESTNGL